MPYSIPSLAPNPGPARLEYRLCVLVQDPHFLPPAIEQGDQGLNQLSGGILEVCTRHTGASEHCRGQNDTWGQKRWLDSQLVRDAGVDEGADDHDGTDEGTSVRRL